MARSGPQPTAYADILRAAVDESDLSVRGVAKALADRTGNSVEDERSALYRYLKTQQPAPDRARMLADILSRPELATVPPVGQRRAGRLRAIEEEVETLTQASGVLLQIAAILFEQVEALGGSIPEGMREELARAAAHMRSGAAKR